MGTGDFWVYWRGGGAGAVCAVCVGEGLEGGESVCGDEKWDGARDGEWEGSGDGHGNGWDDGKWRDDDDDDE